MLVTPALVLVVLPAAVSGQPHRRDTAWPYVPPSFPDGCLGEYSFCNSSGSCTLNSSNVSACAACGKGEYLCPDWRTCAASAAAYKHACPGLNGTHLDETLGIEARLDYLVAHTSLADWIPQLYDNAPAIPHMGIPAYVWLNDDVHGVQSPHATIFPDGCGLGATWDKELMHAVGAALGAEARAAHNGYVHDGDRGTDGSPLGAGSGAGENGVGITMYGPNVNLVRDPRCVRGSGEVSILHESAAEGGGQWLSQALGCALSRLPVRVRAAFARWGRAQEVYGECPTLTSKLAVPFVRGSQGSTITGESRDSRGTWLAGSCCKHCERMHAYTRKHGLGHSVRTCARCGIRCRENPRGPRPLLGAGGRQGHV
jgi:beta-glucosidase